MDLFYLNKSILHNTVYYEKNEGKEEKLPYDGIVDTKAAIFIIIISSSSIIIIIINITSV
jgi:hypothetical protein